MLPLFQPFLHADLDFNGTLQTLEFTADLAPSTQRVSISLYSDGVVEEEEEGFVVLLGVDGLDERDNGSVSVLQQALLITLKDGGGGESIPAHPECGS